MNDSSSPVKSIAILVAIVSLAIGIAACGPSEDRSAKHPADDAHMDKPASQDTLLAEDHDNTQPVPTLAILPFSDSGMSPDFAYLASGFTQALIDRVTERERINVSVRPSFAGADQSAGAVKLAVTGMNVDAVLQGSVSQIKKQFVIIAELTDPESGQSLWKHEYQHPASELNALTSDIAAAVTRSLRGVAPGASAQISSSQAEAYPYYLRGRYFYGGSSEGLVNARRAFEKAIKLEPRFDAAWGWLAATLLLTPDHIQDGMPGNTRAALYKRAQETVAHTLSLNSENALAHAVGGRLAQADNQWANAETALTRAVSLDQFNDMIRNWRGHLYLDVGHVKKAREDFAAAAEINPLNPEHFEMLGYALLAAKDYAAAETAIKQALQMKRATAILPMVFLHMSRGEKTAARELMGRYVESLGYTREILPIKLYLESIDGEDRSDEMYQVILKATERGFKLPKFVLLLASLGKYDEALEHAAKQKSLKMPGIPAYFWLPNMRGVVERPNFQTLARQLGLIEFWQSNGYPDHCRKAADDDSLVCDF